MVSLRVAVCLIHTARLECTRRAVEHLKKTEEIQPDIFLLIQGSQNPETREYLSSINEEATVIYSLENVGCWAGRQILLKYVKDYDYVLIIDNDIMVPSNWFIEMEKTWHSAPEKTAAVGMILDQGGGKFYGGFDFGINGGSLLYSPIHLPYEGDLVCDACMEGAIMIHRDNLHLFQTVLLPQPYSGYDLLLTLWKKGYKFIVCNNVVAKHRSYPTKEYVKIRYHKSASETYGKFRDKWCIRLNWMHEVGVKFPVMLPRWWGYLNYWRQNIYKVLRWIILPIVFIILFRYTAPFYPILESGRGITEIPFFIEFGPLGARTRVATVLLFVYGSMIIASMYLMIEHIPLMVIPFLSLGLAVFATDYWEYPYFILRWIPIYFEQVNAGIRSPLSFLWSASFLHLYGGLATVLLLKIKWTKKRMIAFMGGPWLMWVINQLFPIPNVYRRIYSPLFGPLNPMVIAGRVLPWLPNRIVCSLILLYLLRYVRWRGIWKLYRNFISKLSKQKRGTLPNQQQTQR